MIVKEKSAAMSAKEPSPMIRSRLLAAPASCTFPTCRNFFALFANAGSNITWPQTSHRSRPPFMKLPAVTSAGICTGIVLEPQRPLNLPRAPNRLVHDSQHAQRGTGEKAGVRGVATRRPRRCPRNGEVIERQVLRNVVNGDVKAGSVRNVEDVKSEFHRDALGQFRRLNHG